jgi:hypothetical protein
MRLVRILLLASVTAVVVAVTVATPATARMRSTVLHRHLCETVGGGRFVAIPGFPGERIDRRLLRDIRWMRRKYDIFITDGYSTSPVHAPNGEHPIGLALDIVPEPGRSWGKVADLAHWAEPRQDRPRPPFRWVGWNGDPGHGRGHHLHLSYMHSPTPPRDPARVVYTRRCPVEPTDGLPGYVRASGDASGGTSAGKIAALAPVVPETGGAALLLP